MMEADAFSLKARPFLSCPNYVFHNVKTAFTVRWVSCVLPLRSAAAACSRHVFFWCGVQWFESSSRPGVMEARHMQDLLFELGHVAKGKAADRVAAQVVALHEAAAAVQAAAGSKYGLRYEPPRPSTAGGGAGAHVKAVDLPPIHYYDFVVWWFYNKLPQPLVLSPWMRIIKMKLRLRQKARHKVAKKQAAAALVVVPAIGQGK